MVALDGPQLEPPSLRGARADFAARLSHRLGALHRLVAALEGAPDAVSPCSELRSSFQSLGSAAKVLGFERVAAGFEQAEGILGRAAPERPLCAEDIVLLRRTLARIPSLGWDAPLSLPKTGRARPLSVLGLVPRSLGAALEELDSGLSVDIAPNAAEFRMRLGEAMPNAVLVDADRADAAEAIEGLLGAGCPSIVVGSYPEPEVAARLEARGISRVMAKPTSPQSLGRCLRALEPGRQATAACEPLGELTVPELGHRLAAEVSRRLVDGMDQGSATTRVSLGDGAELMGAVWGAVARVQTAVTLRSGGAVRFDPIAGGGAPIVGDRADSGLQDAVALQGRRAVVADDDPAMVWFLASLLTSVGVEVLEAHDGRRAFELVTAAWPDFVLGDILMPRLDGCGLCREIKRDVAVRDVPVLLLSWKQDLLEHVREIGVGADGYLTKGSSSDQILFQVRRALGTRARLEQRLDLDREVSGELDGLTPRLLLSLVASRRSDTQVRLWDATFLHEVEFRQGRLRSAMRSSSRGTFERGPEALARLLGASAGRFSVTPSDNPCPTEFSGSLPEVLAPHITLARAAMRAVSAESLPGVRRLVLDEASVAAELGWLPGPAAEALQAIRRGVVPREISAAGSASTVEALLATLARRGVVLGVFGEDGEDLLGPGSDVFCFQGRHSNAGEELPAFEFDLTPPPADLSVPLLMIGTPALARSTPPSGALDVAVPWDEQERVELEFADPGHDSNRNPAQEGPIPAWLDLPLPGGTASAEPGAEDHALVLSLADDPEASEPGIDVESCDIREFVGWPEASSDDPEASEPDVDKEPGGTASAEPGAEDHASVLSLTDDPEASEPGIDVESCDIREFVGWPEAPSDEGVAPAGSDGCATVWWMACEGDPGCDTAEVAPSIVTTQPWPSGAAGLSKPDPDMLVGRVPVAGDSVALAREVDLGWDELFAGRAVLEQEPHEVVSSAPNTQHSGSPSNPDSIELGADQAPDAVGRPAEAEAEDAAPHEPDFFSGDFDWDDVAVAKAPAPPIAVPARQEEPERSDPPSAEPLSACDDSPSELGPGDEEVAASAVAVPEEDSPDWAEIVVTNHPALPTGELQELLLFATKPPPAATESEAEPPAMPEVNAPRVRKIEFPARFTKSPQSPGIARMSASEPASAPSDAEPAPITCPAAADEATPPGGEVRVTRPSGGGWRGFATTALITGLAASASFGVVRWWVGPRTQENTLAAAASAGDPAVLSVASATPVGSLHVVKAKAVSEQPKVQESALPDGMSVPAGKGLLEVKTGDRHSIHVDDAFVGLGPVRPVVLDPGQHQVRVKLDGVDRTFPVTVAAARVARIDVATP
jgi:CheY-like chemotaxis protein